MDEGGRPGPAHHIPERFPVNTKSILQTAVVALVVVVAVEKVKTGGGLPKLAR
jgi:hypothetical protein